MLMPMSSAIDVIPILCCLVAAVIDLRTREIPDSLSVVLLLLTPLKVVITESSAWWHHLAGGVIAIAIAVLLSRGERFGGGDVKLFTALGAWFGVAAVIPLAMWIAIAGLPLAIAAALKKQEHFAYCPAILIGVIVQAVAPDLVSRLAGIS